MNLNLLEISDYFSPPAERSTRYNIDSSPSKKNCHRHEEASTLPSKSHFHSHFPPYLELRPSHFHHPNYTFTLTRTPLSLSYSHRPFPGSSTVLSIPWKSSCKKHKLVIVTPQALLHLKTNFSYTNGHSSNHPFHSENRTLCQLHTSHSYQYSHTLQD